MLACWACRTAGKTALFAIFFIMGNQGQLVCHWICISKQMPQLSEMKRQRESQGRTEHVLHCKLSSLVHMKSWKTTDNTDFTEQLNSDNFFFPHNISIFIQDKVGIWSGEKKKSETSLHLIHHFKNKQYFNTTLYCDFFQKANQQYNCQAAHSDYTISSSFNPGFW